MINKIINIFKTYKLYILSFTLPFFIMLLLFALKGIYPFSNNSFMRTDMYHQYVPFFSEYWHKLHKLESLYYTTHVGLGTNFFSIFAYYLTSPFNLFLFFIPQKYIIEFVSYLVIIKIAFSSLSFSYFLSKHSKKKDIFILIFSLLYAFSGYVNAYNWNIMWLDSLILLPLLCLSLERLVNSKNGISYSFLLALTIYSNYYIAIMICLFLVIYYIYLIINREDFEFKKFYITSFRFILYSILGASLVAVLLIPQYYSLLLSASNSISFPKDFKEYFVLFEILVRHLPMIDTQQELLHFPNIYAGFLSVFLLPLYLINKKISIKEKLSSITILFLFYLSFSVNIFNYIWHGLHFPNSLPARNSFLYIFILLLIAFKSVSKINYLKDKDIKLNFLILTGFIFLLQAIISKEQEIHFIVYYLAFIFALAYFIIFKYYRANKKYFSLLVFSFVLTELILNTAYTSIYTSSRDSYISGVKEIKDVLKLKNDEFYRYERINQKTKDDGAFLNFNTASIFSSTAYKSLGDFYKKIGNEASTNAYSTKGQTPLFDSLFALKYGIYETENKNPNLEELIRNENIILYRNPYVLDLVFKDYKSIFSDFNFSSNPVKNHNELSKKLSNEDILTKVAELNIKNKEIYRVKEAGVYYIFVESKDAKELSISLKDKTKKKYDNLARKYFVELGYLDANEEIELDSKEELNLSIYKFEYSTLKKIYDKLKLENLQILNYKDDKFSFILELKEDEDVILSIPYDESFNIKINNQISAYEKVMETFMKLKLKKGKNKVEFSYKPKGIKEGLIISISSFFILMLLSFIEDEFSKRDRKKKLLKISKRE